MSHAEQTWRLADMGRKGTGRVLGIEAALRELVRDVVLDELRQARAARQHAAELLARQRSEHDERERDQEELFLVLSGDGAALGS